MKLIVALGNPGREYQETRHNVGFMVLAELFHRVGRPKPKQKFHGETVETRIAGESVLLLSPVTYMNRSGLSVSEAVRFYKMALTELLVICDDLNLPFGQLRMRSEGSCGGQKGLRDIIQKVASEDFCRLRVGIGRPPGVMETADFVLSKFSAEEQKQVPELTQRAADAVELWVRSGVQETMNRFNAGS